MMRRSRGHSAARALGVTAAVVMLGGCATKSDVRDIQTEIAALGQRQQALVAELQMQARVTQDTLRTQSDQLFDFRGEISRQLREIGEALTRLEALIAANQAGLAGIRDQLANMRTAPTQRPGVTDPGSGEGVAGAEGNPEQEYADAVSAHNRGSLRTARAQFEEFLRRYPNHERAPGVHFLLADILYQQGEVDAALGAFQAVQRLFPTSERVPDALYRVALIQIERGEIDAAKVTLERIINTYAGIPLATLAQQKLNEIG